MSAPASTSSAPPPQTAPNSAAAPPSLSPTLLSSTSSQSHPSPPMTSTSQHSPETRRQIAEARAALEASMSNIGSSLDHTLRSRAENLHSNSKQLEKQQKDVIKATADLRKESEKLRKLADEGSKKIKELGNVQNWAEMLERDFLVLGETLRLANLPSDEEWETDEEGDSMSESDDEERMKRFVYGEHKFVPEESPAVESPAVESPAVESPAVESPAVESPRVDADGDTMMMEDVEGSNSHEERKGMLEQVLGNQPDGFDHGNITEDCIREDKGKGKAIDTQDTVNVDEQQHELVGGSAMATSGSTSDPSSGSIHTAASVTS